MKSATYLMLVLFSLLLLAKKRNSAPIEGNSIKDDRIGRVIIILQSKRLVMQKNQVTLQRRIDI